MAKVKHARARGAGLWLFGGIIAMLALFDAFAWAALWDVPTPLSAVLLAAPVETTALPGAAFTAPAAAHAAGITGSSR